MLPKTHIFLGAIFSFFCFILFPKIGMLGFLIIFLSSVLIDVDHYLVYIFHCGDFSLKKAYVCLKTRRPIKENWRFIMFLHGIEIFIILALVSLVSRIFLFILIGFLFHFSLDIISEFYDKTIKERKFFLLKFIYGE